MSDRQMDIHIVCPWCDTTRVERGYKSYNVAYNPNKKWSIVKFYPCEECNVSIIPRKTRPFKLTAYDYESSSKTSDDM